MSEVGGGRGGRESPEPELEELERRLSAAFAGTRPRRGFEDELWSRLQRRRWSRLFAGRPAAWRGLGAVAAVLVIGLAALLTVPELAGRSSRHPAASPPGQTSRVARPVGPAPGGASARIAPESAPPFGALPAPALAASAPGVRLPDGSVPYYGPARLTVAARPQAPAALPVYRYRQPAAADLDTFAARLGASRAGAAGTPTTYRSSEFRLDLLPAGDGQPPTFAISALAPAATAPAGGAREAGDAFLGSHAALQPSWPSAVSVEQGGGGEVVVYQRQFEVSGAASALQVDAGGLPAGLRLDVQDGAVTGARGPLPLTLESGRYPSRSPDQAVSDAAAQPPAASGPAGAAPVFVLDRVSLVYMAVGGADYGYFVPVYLFSGTAEVQGTAMTKLVAVPALDAAQLR